MFRSDIFGLAMLRLIAFPVLLLGGFWLPGWLLGRLLRLPPAFGGAVLASAGLLMNFLLLLDACGLKFSFEQIGVGLGSFCALAGWWIWRRAPSVTLVTVAKAGSRLSPNPYWIPVGIALMFIAVRAVLDPLSGFDTGFRWDFLAQQMFRTGSLAYYPATTTSDFLNYAWCDGIAPLVSSLYLWSYLCLGEVVNWATVPVVVLVAAVLFNTIGGLAGNGAGARARCLAATSALLLWGITIGQETGLTALTLCMMFWCLERYRVTQMEGWLIWAGIAAGTGALAREYGIVYPALGLFFLVWHCVPGSAMRSFLVTAGLFAGPWYLRNGIKTGNPLWPHELSGLFPGNAVQAAYYRAVGELQGQITGFHALTGAAPILLVTATLPLALGLYAGVRDWRRQLPILVAILVVVALWIWSVAHTSGGLNYSLRVLTPVVALAAALGGRLHLSSSLPRLRWLLPGLLALVGLDAGVRSLHLPWNTHVRWWSQPPMAWRSFSNATKHYATDPQWIEIARVATGRISLVFHPFDHGVLNRLGSPALPLFTPEFRFLFAPKADFSASVRQLRQAGVRFIILASGDPFQDRMLAPHPFFQALATKPPDLVNQNFRLYDLFTLGIDQPTPATHL